MSDSVAPLVAQLQQLSARLGQLQGGLTQDDMQKIQTMVVDASTSGSLDTAALGKILIVADARKHHAPRAYMAALAAAQEIIDTRISAQQDLAAQLSDDGRPAGGSKEQGFKQLKSMAATTQEFSQVVRSTIAASGTNPRAAILAIAQARKQLTSD
jgi:hypothetical protein